MSVLELKSVSFHYGRHAVLEDLSLDLEAGGATALLGPNGSGKSTLLKLMLGLLKPHAGSVLFNGVDLREIPRVELARKLAYVPQVHREAFGYTVFDVALMGRMPHCSFFARYGEHDRSIVFEALERMEIAHLAKRPYTQISGGERQLTLIARALSQGADTFIMDEPSNSLDYGNQLRLLERMSLLARAGYTFLFSTHQPDHARAIANRVVMVRNGRITADGAAHSVMTAESLANLYGFSSHLFALNSAMMHQNAQASTTDGERSS